MPITLIGLDADDTLWHNETHFRLSQQRFADLLASFVDRASVDSRLAAVERRNLGLYGYGAKGFTLSMLETALELAGPALPGSVVEQILAVGRDLMAHPIEPLPGVRPALAALAGRARLVLITKGDLFHQESKLAASGLGDLFSEVEIVSEKNAQTYRRIFARHGARPDEAVMAGNSVRSDILPALEAGSYAALIPYPLVWDHEAAERPVQHPRFKELTALDELAAWIDTIT